MFVRSFVPRLVALFLALVTEALEVDVEKLKRDRILVTNNKHNVSNLQLIIAIKQATQTKATI